MRKVLVGTVCAASERSWYLAVRRFWMIGLSARAHPERYASERVDVSICHSVGFGTVMRRCSDQRTLSQLSSQKRVLIADPIPEGRITTKQHLNMSIFP